MTAIGIVGILLGLVGVYIALYIFGLLFVRRTNDLKTLHKYQALPIWGPLALKKLEAIYSKQLAVCTIAEEANRICQATDVLLPEFYQYALLKWHKLEFQEKKTAIDEAQEQNDEQKLVSLFSEIHYSQVTGKSELKSFVFEALRPFTAKKIQDATTVRELIALNGEEIHLGSYISFHENHDRIDEVLKESYATKLQKLVLCEALATSRRGDVNNLCFLCGTEDSDINMIVGMKRNLLYLSPQVNSFWSSDELLSEINLALMKFLEQQNECCSQES